MIPDLVPSQFASNMISDLRFLSWRYKYGAKVSVFMAIKICHIFTPKWTMTTMHNIPECEHHQLHKLLGGRARLLRSHSPLLPSGGQLLQIHGIGLVATFAINLMPWKKTFSRPLTTQSWQRRTENRIMNSPSRLESKFQCQSSLYRFVYPRL